MAVSDKITPANKSSIFREVGGSVYFECKKSGPFSQDCHVNCGNGKRFRTTSGYCFYLSKGTYTLSVSTRHRNKDLLHTANVTVTEKSRGSSAINRTQVISHNTRHITPSIPTASAPSVNPSTSSARVASPITETQFNNSQTSEALQNTISNTISAQNQEQLISNIASDTLNTNNLSNQNSLGELNAVNNGIGLSSQISNSNISSGNININNNAPQNNNQFSLN